jgi:hypothetical protein
VSGKLLMARLWFGKEGIGQALKRSDFLGLATPGVGRSGIVIVGLDARRKHQIDILASLKCMWAHVLNAGSEKRLSSSGWYTQLDV